MNFQIEPSVLEILSALQRIAPSYISGGYIRDKLLHEKPKDVDIITEASYEDVLSAFPNLKTTEKGKVFGVSRLQHYQNKYDISFAEPSKALHKSRDFTINALFCDGKNIIDLYNSLYDFEHRFVRTTKKVEDTITENPKHYIRAFSLVGRYNFQLEEKLHDFLKENQYIFFINNENYIQQEGYALLQTKHILQVLKYLTEFHFIQTENPIDTSIEIPNLPNKNALLLTYLAYHFGETFTDSYIETFHLSKHLKEKIKHSLYYLKNDKPPSFSLLLNEYILLKTFLLKNDPEKLNHFRKTIFQNH